VETVSALFMANVLSLALCGLQTSTAELSELSAVDDDDDA